MDSPSLVSVAVLSALALALTPAVPAQKPPPAPPLDKPAAPQVSPEFLALQNEYLPEFRAWQVALQQAKDAKKPKAEWPPSPAKAWYPRFEALAGKDIPQAITWCVDNAGSLELDAAATNAKRLALYRQLVQNCTDDNHTRDVLRNLVSEAAPARLGIENAAGICAEALGRTKRDEVRSVAMFTQAQIYATGKDDPAMLAKAKEAYLEIQERYPNRD